MQCVDGGWGGFDVDNNKRLLNKIPFADLESLLDPSTSDVTGRVMELLGKLGYPRQHAVVRRARRFCTRIKPLRGRGTGAGGSTMSMGPGLY
jgi:squalene-hopene/tetraprenyl-beta-curcumene cyclase